MQKGYLMVPVNYGKVNELLMMPDEVDFMVSVINQMPKNGTMVEWGSGASTCKWLDILKENQTLISIEHNLEWFNLVKDSVREHFKDKHLATLNLYYCFDDTYDCYNRQYGNISEELPVGLSSYINVDKDMFNADIFFIDGVARGACLAITLLMKKPDARVFIHDYRKRENWYSWITQFAQVKMVGTTLAEIIR